MALQIEPCQSKIFGQHVYRDRQTIEYPLHCPSYCGLLDPSSFLVKENVGLKSKMLYHLKGMSHACYSANAHNFE